MVNYRKTIVIITIVFIAQWLFVSCGPSQKMLKSFSGIRYGDTTEVVSGFYTELGELYDPETGRKRSVRSYIFYPDQTVCKLHLMDDSLKIYDVHTSLYTFLQMGEKKGEMGRFVGCVQKTRRQCPCGIV